MIPVVGIPHLADYDQLARCIGSVTRHAERVHIIDNSPPMERFEYPHPDVFVTRTHRNIGVGAAWNLLIKLNPWARWWAIINDDVEFGPTTAEALEQAMKVHEVVSFRGFHAFAVRASAIQKVGWFDENFVPAYHEDNDWHYRARLLGVHLEQIDGDLVHAGSAVIGNSEHYRRENNRTFPMTQMYYREKWGGFVGHETYTTPFDRGGSPRDWTLDMTRLANQSWKE